MTNVAGGTRRHDTPLDRRRRPVPVIRQRLTVASGSPSPSSPARRVYLSAGVKLTVANGGRLLAEGTDTRRIRFTRQPGSPSAGAASPSTAAPARPRRASLMRTSSTTAPPPSIPSGGTVFLDHLTFGTTPASTFSLDSSSFVVQDCESSHPATAFEPVHGIGGIKARRARPFLRNFFGAITGYNDTIDFTGGNRPGPIVQFINNVFMGTATTTWTWTAPTPGSKATSSCTSTRTARPTPPAPSAAAATAAIPRRSPSSATSSTTSTRPPWPSRATTSPSSTTRSSARPTRAARTPTAR